MVRGEKVSSCCEGAGCSGCCSCFLSSILRYVAGDGDRDADDPLYRPTLTPELEELRPRLRLRRLFRSTRAPGCIELARRNRFMRAAVPDGDGDDEDEDVGDGSGSGLGKQFGAADPDPAPAGPSLKRRRCATLVVLPPWTVPLDTDAGASREASGMMPLPPPPPPLLPRVLSVVAAAAATAPTAATLCWFGCRWCGSCWPRRGLAWCMGDSVRNGSSSQGLGKSAAVVMMWPPDVLVVTMSVPLWLEKGLSSNS